MEILRCLLADSLSLTTLANGSTTATATAAAAAAATTYTTVTANLGHVFCCKQYRRTLRPSALEDSVLSYKVKCIIMLDFEFTLLEYDVNTIFLWPSVQSENRRCELYSQPFVNKTPNSKLVVTHGWLGLIQAATVVHHCSANLLCLPDGKCVCLRCLSVLLYNNSGKLPYCVLYKRGLHHLPVFIENALLFTDPFADV